MGYLDGFLVTVRQMGRKQRVHARSTRRRRRRSAMRRHGRHVLNRYEDGMEKCIGCELCAGVCPARCIYVRGADNPVDDPVSPGERYGFVYEINYLRCIHCDLCVEACPTEAITETKLFEFSFTNRQRRHLHQGRAARRRRRASPQHLPWEDWRAGEDLHTSAGCGPRRRRATPRFEGEVAWSGELGYGVREPEADQATKDAMTRPHGQAGHVGQDDDMDHGQGHHDDRGAAEPGHGGH